MDWQISAFNSGILSLFVRASHRTALVDRYWQAFSHCNKIYRAKSIALSSLGVMPSTVPPGALQKSPFHCFVETAYWRSDTNIDRSIIWKIHKNTCLRHLSSLVALFHSTSTCHLPKCANYALRCVSFPPAFPGINFTLPIHRIKGPRCLSTLGRSPGMIV